MAFLTKITVVGLLAIGSLASPSPINDDKTLIARTLCSSDVDANVWAIPSK